MLLVQSNYSQSLLQRSQILECALVATCIEEKIKLYLNMEVKFTNTSKYQSLIGSLIYFFHTYPKIVYLINFFIKFMKTLQYLYLKVVKKVLCYIKGTMNYSIFIPNQGNDILMGYIDFDWKRNLGKKKSIIEIIFKIRNTSIH